MGKFDLIRELNSDHAILISKLDAIREQGSVNSKVQTLLTEIRSLLVAHLGKEETSFYPAMRKAAETNENLRETLQIMGTEMEAISAKALTMIDSWLAGEGLVSFTSNFNSFYTLLADRIRREEHNLYSKFLKL